MAIAAAAGTHSVELEGEGWDDTGPFRVEGALRHDGAVECWGVQHGAHPGAAEGSGAADFAHITHGHHHAGGVRAGGGAQCWGDGQGGVGMPADFALAL